MTNKELQNKLKEFPDDIEVYVIDDVQYRELENLHIEDMTRLGHKNILVLSAIQP